VSGILAKGRMTIPVTIVSQSEDCVLLIEVIFFSVLDARPRE